MHAEVTLITGASAGIGAALARRLGDRGDNVVLLGRRRAALVAVADEIRSAGGRAHIAVADVTDADSLATALNEIIRTTGPITRLIANAGGGKRTSMSTFDWPSIETTLRTNLDGVIHSVAQVLPAMQRAGRGHIVVMGSLASARGLPSAAAYSAAKAGIARFTESLAVDLARWHIDVTLLEPGFVAKPGKPAKWPRMPLDHASERMVAAIIQRRPVWRGPLSLRVAVTGLRLLPSRAYIRLMAGRGRS